MRTSLTFGIIIFVAASGCCGAVSGVGESVKITVMGGRPIVSNVFLNGHGPFRFLVDTGAETNQVDASISRRLALAPTFRTEFVTATGTTYVEGGRIREVRLAGALAGDQEFLFTTLDGVHALSGDIQGVFGQEFLSRFDYLLDLSARSLTLGSPAPAGDRIPTERIDGRPALATSLGRLVLDSGSDALVLFREGTRIRLASATLRTASGIATVESAQFPRIRIAGREYTAARCDFIPQTTLAEDGLLPLSVFRAVYVSNSGGYVVLDPGRK